MLFARRNALLAGKKEVPVTKSTVLYADGTLIINELPTDRAANIALYGAVANEMEEIPEKASYNATMVPWKSLISSIVNVKFGSLTNPRMMQGWFKGCTELRAFDTANFDGSELTETSQLFFDCHQLESFSFADFDVSGVTRMAYMFGNCRSMTVCDLSGIDTSSASLMTGMFSGCSALIQLDASGLDTSKATVLGPMFSGCTNLASLDLSGWNTANVTNMRGMFQNCASLETITGDFDMSSVPSAQYSLDMFLNCAALVGGAGTAYDSAHTDGEYARVDNPPDAPGYFTAPAA